MNLFNLFLTRELKAQSSKVIKRYAFTLAEVLITLGIIGVVASMTIPTLMNDSQDAQFKTGLKKNYSVLSAAYSEILNEEGGSFLGICNDADCVKEKFKAKLSFVKDCNLSLTDGTNQCIYDTATKLKAYSNSIPGWKWPAAGLVLKDGTEIITGDTDSTCTQQFENSNVANCGWFVFDVNGPKSPNTIGKDVFHIWITKDRLLPVGAQDENKASASLYNAASCDKSNASATGWGCTAKFLYQ